MRAWEHIACFIGGLAVALLGAFGFLPWFQGKEVPLTLTNLCHFLGNILFFGIALGMIIRSLCD